MSSNASVKNWKEKFSKKYSAHDISTFLIGKNKSASKSYITLSSDSEDLSNYNDDVDYNNDDYRDDDDDDEYDDDNDRLSNVQYDTNNENKELDTNKKNFIENDSVDENKQTLKSHCSVFDSPDSSSEDRKFSEKLEESNVGNFLHISYFSTLN